MTDPHSDAAILARHRDFFRTVHPDIKKAAMEAAEAKQENFRLAVLHLEKVLNGCRNSAEQQAADTAAREWLKSIGNRPGPYYVTAVDGGRWFKMAGPYSGHAAALADVDRARDIASNLDGRAHFMAWGTCRAEGSTDAGTLNKYKLI